ncbi:hypothetical protein L207DRAFT_569355 [Hyaloscypha variabilis F]|uniref:Uncharacterized protein n=1 Tax=Hyaloscypha variabilis (strain UAMH 11265 / GT02V1 / F) TaxID=1149755 RepID=A0A2J6RBR5_HYAVF|nr:hypothetical protein L207DRAFT_569355 [Hyaloscypha variabilis F]
MAPEIWEVSPEPDDEPISNGIVGHNGPRAVEALDTLPARTPTYSDPLTALHSSKTQASTKSGFTSVLPSSSPSSLSSSTSNSTMPSSPPSSSEEPRILRTIEVKKPVKLSRQQERDHAIVQAAIEATSKLAMTTSRKRSHSTHTKDSQSSQAPVAPPAKKPNAFSKMMAASKKEEWAPAPADSRPWTHVFEKALASVATEDNVRFVGERQWADAVSQSIINSVQCQIIPQVFSRAPTQYKLNALHALIEIASAIAYAPQSTASDLVRTGRVPAFLIDEMYKVTELMSEVDVKRVIAEKAFVDKVRELRQRPQILWEGSTWNGLDDVLRVFKDPGPVDFRRIYQKIEDNIAASYGRRKSVKWAMSIIQADVSSYLKSDTCVETRYNAMNVLVDIVLLMQKHYYGHSEYPNDPREFNEALSAALLMIGKSFDISEINQIVHNVDSKGAAALSTHFHDMQALTNYDILCMRRLNGKEHTKLLYRTLGQLKRQSEGDTNKDGGNQCKGSLIAKIMHLRLKTLEKMFDWKTSWDNLDDTIEIFVDTTVVLNFEHYRRKIDSAVRITPMYSMNIDLEWEKKIRDSFEHIISRIFVRASGRANWETKLHAVKILAHIGLCILELCSPTRPPWQTELLNDHLAEDMLTDAMLSLCHSLAKTEEARRLSDEDLVEDMLELDRRRSCIPEAMEGLDGVLSVIRDPESLVSKASKRAKVAAISKMTHVIDLTED